MTSTSKNRAMKRVADSNYEVDQYSIIDTTNLESVKMKFGPRFKTTKSKNLMQPKEPKLRFFTLGARLAFTELR